MASVNAHIFKAGSKAVIASDPAFANLPEDAQAHVGGKAVASKPRVVTDGVANVGFDAKKVLQDLSSQGYSLISASVSIS